jgi:predicted MPP superfamily phosphohydrolase
MVFGDVQLAGPFKADPTLSAWKSGRLDTSEFAARFAEALRDSKPTQILQTGDFVDLNESGVLDVRTPTGEPTERLPQGWQEWAPMLALLPKEPKVYPVVGNHERYGELVVKGVVAPDGTHVELEGLKLAKKASSEEVHDTMLTHFPHLREGAEFHDRSGSYYVSFGRYCLLSLDGADFDDDPSLFDFVDAKLTHCAAAHKTAVVSNHYPLFSGRPKAVDDSLELAKHRTRLIDMFSRHHVALVFSGHEHFYLRYLEPGLTRAGYGDKPSNLPIYVTVSDFTNPYSRTFERMEPIADGDARYFKGTHYATVTFGDHELRVVAKGFDRQAVKWREIDAFSVGE